MFRNKRLYPMLVLFALGALIMGGMAQTQAAATSNASVASLPQTQSASSQATKGGSAGIAAPAQTQNPYSPQWLAANHGKFDNIWTAAYETSLQQQAHPELFNGPTSPNFGVDVRMSNPNFSGSQNEFQISINPTDSHFAVGSSNDGRTVGVGLYRTTDSGQTWSAIDAPVPPSCCDPGVVYAYNGTVYASILSNASSTYIISSTNNGLTWSSPTSVSTPDRSNITVDNGATSPRLGTVYVTYSDLPATNRIKGYKSTDNGVTWSASFFVGDVAPAQGYEQASQPRVASDGTLYVGYQQYTSSSAGCSAGVQNVLAKSTDGGATFTYTVVPIVQGGACTSAQAGRGIFCINSSNSSFRSRSQFVVGIKPTNPQQVYVIYSGGDLESAYTCGTATGFHSDILFRKSTDGGATFSAATKINSDGQGKDQYFPWMDVSADGALHVGWNDRREDPNDYLSRWYQAYSIDEGATWSQSPVADVQTQPSTFIGDYHGLAAANNLELGMWYDSRNNASGDPYTDPNVPSGVGTPTPTITPGGPTLTPTLTHTPTPTATNTATATPTPCLGANAVQNPGFETGSFAPWVISDTTPTPTVVMTQAHSGTHSAFLGSLPGTEPLGNTSFYQQVTVPAGSSTLSFWYYPFSQDTIAFDWQDAYIENTSGTILATVMHVDDNTSTWTNKTFDMTPYAGQTVRIVFLVHQDGFGDVTNMYVDDVAIQTAVACGTPTNTVTPGGPTFTPVPPTSTPTTTPTTTPTPCTLTASGQLIVSGQTDADPNHSDLHVIVTNTVHYAHDSSQIKNDTFAIFQTHDPFGATVLKTGITRAGYNYSVFGLSSLATVNLSDYAVVVLNFDDNSIEQFLTQYSAALPRLEAYVHSGGILWMKVATNASQTAQFNLPFGGTGDHSVANANIILNSGNPIMDGVPSLVQEPSISTSEFNDVPNGGLILALQGDFDSQPTAYVFGPNVGGCATSTPQATNTPTATNTTVPATNTPVATNTMTATNTPVATSTMTATNTAVPTVTPTDCPNPFVDVTGNLFYTAIHYLNCRGVVGGLDPSHYGPAGTSTRGQFAKVVVLGFGTPFFTPATQDFVDVSPSYFAYVYIESGFHAGILSGFDPASCTAHGLGTPCYLPNLPITRGQLTKLVVNAGGYTLITPTGGMQDFTDVSPSNVFYVSIETAFHAGIIAGYPDRTFQPNANIRRDQMAQIVYEGIIHRP